MNSKEEAIAKGIRLAPPKNTKTRRAPWHNYALPGLYMLTLVLSERRPLLGRLVCEPRPHIDLSPLGQAILLQEFQKIPAFYPNVKVWKKCMMPDHMHIVVEVAAPFPDKKHLGNVVAGFKSGCNRAYRSLSGVEQGSMFAPNYNDRIILPGLQYERWKRYLDDNPRRLAIKRRYPEYFVTRYSYRVCDYDCQTFGNLFLLEIPDKMDVIVHRSDSDEEYARKCQQWMACGERGGVLVGAFIAEREKKVLQEGAERGYNIIQLCDNGFGPYHKPSGAAFDACAAGTLLQISLWDYSAKRLRISRQECILLNNLAGKIARHPGEG